MLIPLTDRKGYAKALADGLKKLGPNFTAEICFWCNGEGARDFKHCNVCGCNSMYGRNNGLLWNSRSPASDSVAYQVLNAAGYQWPE